MTETQHSPGFELGTMTPSTSPEIIKSKSPFDDTDNNAASMDSEPPTPSRSVFRLSMILIAAYLSLFLAALDVTIVATAVPTITSALDSPSGYAWIGGAYLISVAAASPIWASLSNIWGRRPLFLSAVALFMASSTLSAFSRSMPMLIAGRAIQGVAGGGLMMLVDLVISDVFSMRQRSLFIGLCEAIWALAGAVGPVLGGALTTLASWRWCWWINLPFCAIAFFLLFFFLDVHNPKTELKEGMKAIDWAGSLSILAVTIMILLGLDFGGEIFPWSSPKVICLIVFGAFCSLLFIYSEKRLAKYPLMPLKLFAKRSNVAILMVVFFHAMSYVGVEYYLPLYFQAGMEASPLRSGVLLIPIIVTTSLMGVVSGVIIHRTGRYREIIWLGPVLLTIGNGLFIAYTATSPIGQIIGFQLVAGAGSGMQFMPPMVAMQAMVSQDDMATTIATLNFTRSMGLAISVVLGGVVFQNSMDKQAARLHAAGLSPTLLEQLSGKNAAANAMITKTIADAGQKLAAKEAFAASLRNAWILYTCLSAGGVVASWFVAKTVLSKEHKETITGLKDRKEKVTPPSPTLPTSV